MKTYSFSFLLFFCLPIITLFSFLIPQHLYAATNQAEPVLQDVEFITVTPEYEQITFLLDGSFAPRIFTFNGEKPRIIIDFPKTIPAMTIANIIKTNGNLVKRIRMGIHKGDKAKTRIALDLALDMEIAYKQVINQENNSLLVSVYKAGTEPELPQAESVLLETLKPLKPLTDNQEEEKKETKEEKVEPLEKQRGKFPDPFRQAEIVIESSGEETSSAEPVKIAKAAEIKPPPPPVLYSIRFDNSTGKGEMVQFLLNGFYPPKIYAIEKGVPRIVCDFKNTTLAKSIPNIIKADGRFIKSIRTGKHNNPDKIRVVIDLMPNNHYDLEQIFFKEDKMFVIIVNTKDK